MCVRGLRRLFSGRNRNFRFDIGTDRSDFIEIRKRILGFDSKLLGGECQSRFFDSGQSRNFSFHLSRTVGTAKIVHNEDLRFKSGRRFTGNHLHFRFDGRTDRLNLRKQSVGICCCKTKLFGGKCNRGFFYIRKRIDFSFHLSCTVGTAQILKNVDLALSRGSMFFGMMLMFMMVVMSASTIMMFVFVMLMSTTTAARFFIMMFGMFF